MNKGLGAIALVTLLSCLSVTTLGSDRLWAQEASDRRAEAGRFTCWDSTTNQLIFFNSV
jgi:hypothetical protein